MKLLTVARATTLLAASLLAACGSTMSDDGANLGEARASNPLASVDDVAKAAAYVTIANALDDTTESLSSFTPSLSKAYSMAKLMVSDQCAGGGRYSYNDESGDETIMIDFDDCRDNDGSFVDGAVTLVCLSGSFDDDSCRNLLITFGKGNADFRYSDAATSGRIKGTWQGQEGSTFVKIDQSLSVEVQHVDGGQDLAAVTEGFVRDVEDLGNDNYLLGIEGDIGLSYRSETVECATGMVNFHTLQPVYIDAGNRPTAGRIRLTNIDGISATVEFMDDGNLMVTLNDGSTGTVTADRFDGFCNFD